MIELLEWPGKPKPIDDALLDGLDRRSLRLLRASDDEWLKWLDDDDFWKPGWRDEPRGEVE